MHPGNIRVADDGRYIALDFGIMGTLTEVDKNYLAQNFLAFNRDYCRVAQAHLEAGWVPPATRIDEFEAAIRAVCEAGVRAAAQGDLLWKAAAAPLSDLAALQRRGAAAASHAAEDAPQHRRARRELDPELDLWRTAKPLLERWMASRSAGGGSRACCGTRRRSAQTLPQLPRLIHRALSEDRLGACSSRWSASRSRTRGRNRLGSLRFSRPSSWACCSLRLDSSAAEFWDTRFRELARTCWDAGRAPPRLESWLAGKTPGSKVLVPGCGTATRWRSSRAMATMCSA